jgi:transcriptional regulator with XRE-family HTH domain
VLTIFFLCPDFRGMTKIRDIELLKNFGQNLRKLRESKSISQEELAYKADIPINQVGRIERGEVNTTISTLNSIAKALDICLKDLLDF